MIISIGNDHAGPELKKAIIKHIQALGHTVINNGTDTLESVDYPDFGHAVAKDIEQNKATLGIVICGSGNGIAITANKHQGIRCALCWNSEIAELARAHNDANVMSIPARFISENEAIKMVDVFIKTAFEGGRHAQRINKIACK